MKSRWDALFIWISVSMLHYFLLASVKGAVRPEIKTERQPLQVAWVYEPKMSVEADETPKPMPESAQVQDVASRKLPPTPEHENTKQAASPLVVRKAWKKQSVKSENSVSASVSHRVEKQVDTAATVSARSAQQPALSGASNSLEFISASQLRFRRRVIPQYPPAARVKGIEGVAKILLSINEQGRSVQVLLQQSSGSAVLDQAALAAASESSFYPYTRNGLAQSVKAIIPYHFSLHH
ncbi:energy transducer TonB [Escherichia albertii]|uniref:energy transducer TonB n=1 Tax=Escherichia albertii TaxID=208962 RepID=UPI0002BB8053|nr:energy transducer TonB [Escherichia albertii]EFF0781047.1 energy transducer TonB [Escherichia albertii]MCZ8654701.1 TonB family protein [Escherichia albertii]WDB32871.1 TonB family protein [Escherichia albertii]